MGRQKVLKKQNLILKYCKEPSITYYQNGMSFFLIFCLHRLFWHTSKSSANPVKSMKFLSYNWDWKYIFLNFVMISLLRENIDNHDYEKFLSSLFVCSSVFGIFANNSVKFWALLSSDVEEWCIHKVQMCLSLLASE